MSGNWQPLIDQATSLLKIFEVALVIVGIVTFAKALIRFFDGE